jgi:hypothetical protein
VRFLNSIHMIALLVANLLQLMLQLFEGGLHVHHLSGLRRVRKISGVLETGNELCLADRKCIVFSKPENSSV